MKRVCYAIASIIGGMLLATASWAEADLSEVELKWLNAAEPVLDFARTQGLAIDIVVTPQASAGDVPFSMGVKEGRCKLLLSMRGNSDAESTLADSPAENHALLIEAMTAHEVAHCWRYAKGQWHEPPAGFIAARDSGESDSVEAQTLRAKKKTMRATRREEGYADLVALAWISRRHPNDYDAVHAWLERIRQSQPLSGSYHDTRVWLALAKDPSAFHADASPFQQVQDLWISGLKNEE